MKEVTIIAREGRPVFRWEAEDAYPSEGSVIMESARVFPHGNPNDRTDLLIAVPMPGELIVINDR